MIGCMIILSGIPVYMLSKKTPRFAVMSPRDIGFLFLLFLFTGGLCHAQGTQGGQAADQWSLERRLMVEAQIESRGVKDQRVLEAMKKVERHKFVPAALFPPNLPGVSLSLL